MTTVPGNVRLTRHIADLDDSGHDTLATGLPPLVVYAECNSPSGSGGDNPVPWDKYYDETQSLISGGGLTAALAAIGLTVSGNVFTATAPGLYLLELEFSPKAAPSGQANLIAFSTSGFLGDPNVSWGTASPQNPPPGHWITFPVYLGTGDTFKVRTNATGTVTDGVITYADMSIMKVA